METWASVGPGMEVQGIWGFLGFCTTTLGLTQAFPTYRDPTQNLQGLISVSREPQISLPAERLSEIPWAWGYLC